MGGFRVRDGVGMGLGLGLGLTQGFMYYGSKLLELKLPPGEGFGKNKSSTENHS